jgi:hypothetical protein
MKTLNENNTEENALSIEETNNLANVLDKINQESKDNHAWLEEKQTASSGTDSGIEVQPLTLRHVPSSIDELIEGAPVKRDTTVGWLKPADGGLELSIDVEGKLKHWLKENGGIRLQVKKLNRPTEYYATHRCLFAGKAHTPPTIADTANKVLAVIRDKSLDDFEFSVSPETIRSFMFRWKGKVWLKLFIKTQNNAVWIYG